MTSVDLGDGATPGAEPLAGASVGEGSAPRGARWRRWATAVAALLVVLVAARATRSEVRYETDPSGRPPLERSAVDDLAARSAGTRCGDWPAVLSTSEAPRVAPLHTAVWADADAFHVRSAHLFVRAVRIDVEGGTASGGGAAEGSLSLPLPPGETADVAVSCGATAITIHLVGADGKDVAGALLGIGAGPGARAPIRLARDGRDVAAVAAPEECAALTDAFRAVGAAASSRTRAEAAEQLLAVAQTTRTSLAASLTGDERADADALIGLLDDRLAELRAGDPDADRPGTAEEQAATAGVAEAFQRLCGGAVGPHG